MMDRSWFTHDRFGMFIHFGLYSVAARHEWVMMREQQTPEQYSGYAARFDPDLLDARAWARSAREAGMRYLVLTTKHHDGFCLWDSALTDFTSMHTPFGRDLVREVVDAARGEGLRVGLYHSLIDWHHPDFTIDALHPLRNDAAAVAANATRSMERYREYLHGQVRELLTRYGTIDYLFFDFSYDRSDPSVPDGKGAADWGAAELLAMVRELQPGALVNDRLGIQADVITPEQYQPTSGFRDEAGDAARWEACQTFNGSWGYDRDNAGFKTPDLLVRMLVETVAADGNLLLNVGPNGRGEFGPDVVARLDAIGEWMRLHEGSIRGAGAAPWTPPPDTRCTRRGDRVYLHLFAWPFEHLHVPGLEGRVGFARLLHDGSEVTIVRNDPSAQAYATTMPSRPEGTLTLRLPTRRPDVLVPVVELFLEDAA